MWSAVGRALGIGSSLFIFSGAAGVAAHDAAGIDPALGSIVAAFLAATGAVVSAIVLTRRSNKPPDDDSDDLLKIAVAVSLLHAGADDDTERAEAAELARHLRHELEAKVGVPKRKGRRRAR